MKPTNTGNHACNMRRAWRRTWTLANLANIPVMAAWAYHKELTNTEKTAIDSLARDRTKISNREQNTLTALTTKANIYYFTEPTQTTHPSIHWITGHHPRPSLGDPTRPPRAGAPKETLQTPKETLGTPLITLKTLLELKEICQKGFNGDWNLLANYADELGDAKDTLRNILKAP